MDATFILFTLLLINSCRGTTDKYEQAAFRARLSKAKSMQEALLVLKTSSKQSQARLLPAELISPQALEKEHKTIQATAKQYVQNRQVVIEPRNGGCEPRVICEEVPVDRTNNENIISFPQCVEVHRCGGCCQEPQFPCVAVQQVPVTFSPLLLISLDFTDRYEVNRPLTVMNHTQCECKCGKTEQECRLEGKILDITLCQCVQPRCTPECPISSTCSIVSGADTPRCVCRRRIPGQNGNFCQNANQRPNIMCSRCEWYNG